MDEFSRINAIKGQQAKGRGSTMPCSSSPKGDRRGACECPVQKWITVDELFRLLKASARDSGATHDAWKLYISEQRYGGLGYDSPLFVGDAPGPFLAGVPL